MVNAFRETWDCALATQSPPTHFIGITRFSYADFRARALGDNLDLARDFVDPIYGGQVVVLDDAFTRA